MVFGGAFIRRSNPLAIQQPWFRQGLRPRRPLGEPAKRQGVELGLHPGWVDKQRVGGVDGPAAAGDGFSVSKAQMLPKGADHNFALGVGWLAHAIHLAVQVAVVL